LKKTVEELETLKEINDELEKSHTETEKQLQIELGMSFNIGMCIDLTSIIILDAANSELQGFKENLVPHIQFLQTTVQQYRDTLVTYERYCCQPCSHPSNPVNDCVFPS
jgi:hypothetical protein